MRYRKIRLLLLPFGMVFLFTCKNVQDVRPTNRITFIKMFEKGSNYSAQVAEPLADGYLIGSNVTDKNYTSFISKVDLYGNIIWEKSIASSSVSSMRVVSDGYLILGDVIQTNDTALNVNDRTVTKALLTKMDLTGSVIRSTELFDQKDLHSHFHGTGVTLDNEGNILTTGNRKASQPNAVSLAYVAVYNPTTLDTLWTRHFGLIDQDNLNAKNVFTTGTGNIIWSNSVQKTNLSQTLSYLTVSSVTPQATFIGYDFLGSTQNRLAAQEMQASLFGYGIIGTFSDGQGNNGNAFFVKVDPTGKFLANSLLFFDGVAGAVPSDASALNNPPSSQSDDVGRALCATPDGGFLLGGSLSSTIQRGNGGLDIWLIRIDKAGNVLWDKIFGSAGDETVNSVRSLPDGGFLIAGGSSTSGLSAAFLMRIDKNGEIKN